MRIDYLLCRLAAIAVLILVSVPAVDAGAQVVPRPDKPGRKYRVRIDSAPQQAAVYLDDEKYGIVGYTPWSGRIERGQWKIILKKDGYEIATRVVDIKRTRRVQEIFMPMVKRIEPGVVEVRADADKNAFDAEVWIDGQLQGKVPLTVKLDDGRHLVELKKDGFERFSQWVGIEQGERVTINPMMRSSKKEVGSILIDADVAGAEVYLDGNKHTDATPTLIPNVPAGPHVIEVRKEPALPWRQTVQVVAGETFKVTANLKATLGGQGGNIRVLSNVKEAEVFLDGDSVGKAPIDIKDVAPGEHVIEARAPGYRTKQERVKVSAGSATVLELDLNTAGSVGTLKVVSPVPEATVFIDGEKIGNVPQSRQIAAGEHFVVVSKPGYQTLEKKLRIDEGKTVTITAELRAVGGLRLLSNPSGAEILIDGQPIGKTPMVSEDISVGEHIVTMRLEGYYDAEEAVSIEGGKVGVVNATMKMIDTGPTAAERAREQKGLTSFGARTLSRGRSTIDFGGGFPYFMEGGITVGAGKIGGQFGFDAGVLFRSYLTKNELAVKARLNLFDRSPFSMGLFGMAGGGTSLFDDSKRYSAFADAGAAVSLTGLGAVTVTGRAYLNMWVDRHCPEPVGGSFSSETEPVDTCIAYLGGTLPAQDKAQLDEILGGEDEIFSKDVGARIMTSFIVEIALRQRWNIWLLVEGAPFQGERAAYTDYFYAPMFERDPGTYFRMGGTYKF